MVYSTSGYRNSPEGNALEIEYLLMVGAISIGLLYILFSASLKRRTRTVIIRQGTSGPVTEFEAYRRLTAEDPDNPDHWVKWGNALASSAPSAKNPDLKIHRYNEACSCFQRAVEIQPGYVQGWKNWGQTLYEIFRQQKSQDTSLLEQANSKYSHAVTIHPEDAQLWQHWGEELIMAAYSSSGEQKRRLQEDGAAKLARAGELNPALGSPRPAAQSPLGPVSAPGGPSSSRAGGQGAVS